MAARSRCPGCMVDIGGALVCPACGWDDRTTSPSNLYLPPGAVLHGQYLVGRVLGHGGFGVTYLGWDLNLDIRLAIKEFLPQQLVFRSTGQFTVNAYDDECQAAFSYGLDKFLDEARTLARFHDHSAIVSVLNYFREHGTGYMVMPYVEGQTLRQFLERHGGRIPAQTALKLLSPVMEALRAVHQVGLLHRDVSPDNIYLTADDKVMLLDFGAARYFVGERSPSLSVILKPGYAPEEQYRRRGKQGPWTDVYALGATLYHAITGQIPPESLERLERDTLLPPTQLGVVISPHVEAALLKALAPRAADRYQEISALQTVMLEPGSLPPGIIDNVDIKDRDRFDKPNLLPGVRDQPRPAVGWLWAGTIATLAFGLLAAIKPDPFSIFFILLLAVDGIYGLYWLTRKLNTPLVADEQRPAWTLPPTPAPAPQPVSPQPARDSWILHCLEGEYAGSRLEIPPEGIIIGRDNRQVNLVLHDDRVSRRHARLYVSKLPAPGGPIDSITLADLNSANGTYVRVLDTSVRGYHWEELGSATDIKTDIAGQHFRIGDDIAVFAVTKKS